MNDFGAALDRAIGEPPKSTVDVDAVMARERRRGRLRRGGAIGSATVAVAGIAVGAVALVTVPPSSARPPGRPGTAATTQAGPQPGNPTRPHSCPPVRQPSPTPSRSPWITGEPSPTAVPTGPASALPVGAAARLTKTLQAAVRTVVGKPVLAAGQWGPTHRPLVFNAGPCAPVPGPYFAAASVLTATRPPARLGDLLVQVDLVGSGGGAVRARCGTPGENETACTESRGPRGEVVVAATWHGERQGTPPAAWHDVTIGKPDGTVVTLLCGGAGPAHPEPPFTVPQLIKIGLDPRLTLG